MSGIKISTPRCHHGTRYEETCPECTAEIVQLRADKAELVGVLKLLSEVDDPDKVITANWSANDWRQAKRQYNQTCLDAIAKHATPEQRHENEHGSHNDPACNICQDRIAEDKP